MSLFTENPKQLTGFGRLCLLLVCTALVAGGILLAGWWFS